MGSTSSESSVSARRLRQLVGDPASAQSTFEWLADRLVGLWSDGRLEPGTRLPAERALAEELGVSRGTVVRALAVAESRGVVRARQGSGRIVTRPRRGAVPTELLAPGMRSAQQGEIDLRSTLLPPHPALNEAMHAVTDSLCVDPARGVTEGHGDPDLIERILIHYEDRGLPTSPDQILIVNGAVSGTHMGIRALIRPGGRVAVETPHYPNTFRAVEAAGARCVPVDITADSDGGRSGLEGGRRWGESMLEVVRAGSVDAAIVTADFQNPTGMLMGDSLRSELLTAAAKTGTTLIADETLAAMNWRKLAMPAPMAGKNSTHSILIGSTSKSHWFQLRVGWIRGSTETIERIRRTRLGVDLGTPVFEQRVAARLFCAPGPAPVDLVRSRYEALTESLGLLVPQLEYQQPYGGLSLWATIRGRSSNDVVRAAQREGLLLTAGALFSPTAYGWPENIRLPFSAPEHDLRRAAQILADILR